MVENKYLAATFLLLICFPLSQGKQNERKRIRENELDGIGGHSLKKDERATASVYTIEAQPRMYTQAGHLFFQTGPDLNINFKTDGDGKVNLNDNDITNIMDMVNKNVEDIEELKQNGGGTVPQSLIDKVNNNTDFIANNQDQINQHNGRLLTLENNYEELRQQVGEIQSKLTNNECTSSPCDNGGTCVDLFDDFLCKCNNKWEGPTCSEDVNECITLQDFGLGCRNGGTCLNTDGSFSCSCPPEFFGRLCTSQYDDCSDGSSKCEHGICVDSSREQDNVPNYTCVCEDGWKVPDDATDPACSEDVDECTEKPCSKNPEVPCYNNPGSYTCGQCPNGFVGNGWACTDVDECATNNGGCSTSPPVSCINTPGSSTCGPCPSGYTGNGRTCSALDACSVDNGGCHPLATCTTNPAIGPNAVTCTCPGGYTGNGIGPNGCTLNPTDCSTSCENGQCMNDGSGAQVCACDPGWTGGNCDENIDECSSSPCQNGGSCIDGVNGYYCNCDTNYGGANCEIDESGCGAYYRQDSGSFSFPANPSLNSYPNSASCAWVIEASLGKVLQITFPIFEIQLSADCSSDYLQLHDGNSAAAQFIGKYCGTDPPGDPFITTHNVIYMWFRSDAQNNGQGIQVVWQTTDPECGEDITGATFGEVSSPGYPGDYPASRDCYWTIHVQAGNVIQFLFGPISIENHPDCSFDYLEIRNGLSELDPQIGIYCSSISPSPLLTTAPGAWIHFHSDETHSDGGFRITWTTQPSGINGCGGYLSDDDGIVISPNWPNAYDSNQECFWQIHIGLTGKISLNFTHMDIEEQTQCLYDYVEVRDGPDETAPLVARHCGQELPPVFISSSNDLWLKLRSDSGQSGSGFRATYTVACGGTYTAESDELLSPYYPNQYPNHKNCYYLIRQEPGHVITLTFEDFSLEHVPNCYYDYIEIRDGSGEDSPLLAKLCGSEVPVPIMSSNNYMWVHFSTDQEAGASGFKATYVSEYSGCGGVYTDLSGTLQSPGHPTPYPHGANCTYFISVAPGYIINFHFISFSLQPANALNECEDFVEMFDGPDINSPSLGRFCGSILPPATVSGSYSLTVLFSADSSIDSDGFAAAYSVLNASTACGKRLTDNQGRVTSPNYPNNYYDARSCVWTITVDSTMQIQASFTDFLLENKNAEGVCVYDYLELRNGGYEDSALIGTYCGSDSPGTFTTHGNQLYMEFFTDPFMNDRGFLMEYDVALTGCGGTLTAADGYFQSPNYPFPYNHNAACFWWIMVSEGSIVRLTFTAFDIETHGYCEYDYIEVYDGPSLSYPSLGRQCGSRIPPPYESSRNTLLVEFRTDVNTAGSGFLAQYHVECTRTISTLSSGVIQSLDYPNNYPPNRDCAWTIQATRGNKINVTFTFFSMETCNDCSCDYLQLIDGDDPTDTTLGKFCDQFPTPFQTTSDKLLVIFHSDPYFQSPGFEMVWAIDGCGDSLVGPTGSLSSPNYPDIYDGNRECIWLITTGVGTSVELTISDFDVENHEQCDYDVLEVYNGHTIDSSYRLAQLCNAPGNNHNLPFIISSTSSFMSVRFSTDDLVHGRGFTATYQETIGQCGGQLASASGSFTSPNYPGNYGSMKDCEWSIDVGEGSTVLITFEAFDIEPEVGCSFDYLAIYDGNTTDAPLLLKACGAAVPEPVRSTGHLVVVQFHSDSSSSHTGFRASFSSGCGGIITVTEDGDISSPNYPDPYPANTNCTWILQSPNLDGHVTVTFTHMDFYFDPSTDGTCGTYDYLDVLDGPGLTAPPYSLYCGTTLPAPITSFSNAFTITMVSTSDYQRTGFRAIYSASTSRCGGDLIAQRGYFNSPSFPDPYPTGVSCTWTVSSSPGNGIHLQFLSFDLEEQSSCLFDYVQIREGSSTGPILAQLCGIEVPENLTSVDGHVLYIIFRSDFSTVGTGFQVSYQHTYGSVSIGEFEGILSSPMYPGLYPSYLDVYYYVYAPAGRLISYRFVVFELEQPTEQGCIYDFVAIYDGDSTEFPFLFLGCGDEYLPSGQSTQGAITLYFHSDWGINARGYYMTWEAIDGEGIPPNPTNVPTVPPGSCGSSHLVASVNPITFVSPGWPGNYGDHLDCVWVIESAPGFRVSLTIGYIDIEDLNSCGYDYISVHAGPDVNSLELARFCGREIPENPVLSLSTFMTVRFRTDASISYTGFNATYQQACGGLLVSDLGVVQSPNYPFSYPSSTVCEWVIISTLGSHITLTFESEFEIQNSNDGECNDDGGDYLLLRNGRDEDSPPLNPDGGDGNGRYCGVSSPQGLATSSNGLVVRFRSDDVTSGTGFKFTFSSRDAACGSRLLLTDEVSSQTFESPNYQNAFPEGIDCYWIITCPSTESIQLDFLEFNLEDDANCENDYVMVMEGRTGDGEVLGRFCGQDQPPTTTSIGNEMTVRMRADADPVVIGFRARYSIAICGGTLVGAGGTLTSPNHPDSYPTSTTCEWVVRGPRYHFLSFTFNSLNLSTSSESSFCGDGIGDYIEIRSNNFSGPILRTVCGVLTPIVIETLEETAYVRFVSDAAENSESGFSMNYIASEDECGGDLNNEGGTISTPNYPNAYDHSRVCRWNIVVPEDRRVTLTFNAFRIENPYEDGYCYWDYVEVFNGINSNSPSLSGRRCGGVMPPPYASTGNTMLVVFVTDASVSNGGFLATYDSRSNRVCGGRLNLPGGGNFTSPNYPDQYENLMECIWTIENPNPSNSSTLIRFSSFSVEDHVICDFDQLHFRTGSTFEGYPIATYCGQTVPQPFGVAFPETFVQFVTDPFVTDTGFFASYTFTTCGGLVIGTTNGVITSPNFPNTYDDDDYCLWTIFVEEGHKVDLIFTDFEVELHNSCVYDYLKIFNGPSTDSPLIGTYCGDDRPDRFHSGSNAITILFQSDYIVSRGGWRFEWSADNSGCGNIIYHDHTGTITSPNYPDNYPQNIDCLWLVVADPAYHVEMTFVEEFNIEHVNELCNFDFVAVYDGISEFGTELGRYCGEEGDENYPPEDPISSSDHEMTIRFRTDFSVARTGFKANWEAVCGITLSAESGTFQSPNFPAAYNNNEYCEFIIILDDELSFIKLEFPQFNVEPGSTPTQCDYDYVRIYGSSESNAPLLGSYCGNLQPLSPLSSEGSMRIVFSTDPSTVDYGFQAVYESSQCGGFINASSGSINAFTHSDLHNNRNCTWQINVATLKIIELRFSTFDLESHSSCLYDNVKIYDGPNVGSSLIGTYCGTRIPDYIMTTGNTMTIEYITDDLITGNGFTANFRETPGPLEGCGGVLAGNSGEFSSPDLNGNGLYDENLNCLWLIEADTNKIINLRFDTFELEGAVGLECRYDFVNVRDGYTVYDPLVVTACGEAVPVPFTSSGNTLFVRFVSDFVIERPGFNASYTTDDQTCGGIYDVTDELVAISSPALSSTDGELFNCRWTLDAGTDTSKYIFISFDDIFINSTANQETSCSSSFVELRDYPLGDYGQVVKYCGSDLPPDFYSLGQIVQINFRTDTVTSGRGFKLQYSLTSCSRNRTQSQGQLFSPGWPDPYVHNLECVILIRVEEENEIQLFFNFFDIEYQDSCNFDHLNVRNGSSSDAPLLKSLCGNQLPEPIFVENNEVLLELNTDPFLVGKGFDITYTSSPDSCGGDIIGDHGSIYSSFYPQPYQPNKDCAYIVRTPPNRPVLIHITFIDVYLECEENGCFCVDDLLYIYGGPSIDSPLINAYCGYGTLRDLQSPTNAATIRLRTRNWESGSRSNTGFRVDFES